MPQVSVTVAGRLYRMSCGEGEEAHLHELAQTLDARILAMRDQFGEIGDQRITIMAAITLADDLSEATAQLASLRGDLEALGRDHAALETRVESLVTAMTGRLEEAAARMEQAARRLSDGRP